MRCLVTPSQGLTWAGGLWGCEDAVLGLPRALPTAQESRSCSPPHPPLSQERPSHSSVSRMAGRWGFQAKSRTLSSSNCICSMYRLQGVSKAISPTPAGGRGRR